jgi:hypothetical protein
VIPRGSCKNRCFGGTYRLHHQGGKKWFFAVCFSFYLRPTMFRARLFFQPDDGGDTSLRNVETNKSHAAPLPRRQHSSSIVEDLRVNSTGNDFIIMNLRKPKYWGPKFCPLNPVDISRLFKLLRSLKRSRLRRLFVNYNRPLLSITSLSLIFFIRQYYWWERSRKLILTTVGDPPR